MSYELLIFKKDWVFKNPSAAKYETLTRLVNKAYSKPMAKYGIIQSPRIKTPESFLQCLGLAPEKDCVIVLLLGAENIFDRLQRDKGYMRKFNANIWPLAGCNDSDLRSDLSQEFGPLTAESVRVHTLNEKDELNPCILDRCLASIGFKGTHPIDSGNPISRSEKAPSTFNDKAWISSTKGSMLELELTAYTSFMSGGGASLLEFVVSHWLATGKNDWFTERDVSSYVLLATVIKEHDLVSYYTKKCGFRSSGQPDIVVDVSGADSPLEAGIKATSDFTLSILKRVVRVEN